MFRRQLVSSAAPTSVVPVPQSVGQFAPNEFAWELAPRASESRAAVLLTLGLGVRAAGIIGGSGGRVPQERERR